MKHCITLNRSSSTLASRRPPIIMFRALSRGLSPISASLRASSDFSTSSILFSSSGEMYFSTVTSLSSTESRRSGCSSISRLGSISKSSSLSWLMILLMRMFFSRMRAISFSLVRKASENSLLKVSLILKIQSYVQNRLSFGVLLCDHTNLQEDNLVFLHNWWVDMKLVTQEFWLSP